MMQAQARPSYERSIPSSPARDIHATRPLDRIDAYVNTPPITEPHLSPTFADYSGAKVEDAPYKPLQATVDASAPRAALGMLNLPNANRSTSSLMDAVFGSDGREMRQQPHTSTPVPLRAPAPVPQAYAQRAGPVGVSPLNAGRPVRRGSVRDPRRPGLSAGASSSRRGSNSNSETTDSWDKMSDAESARVAEDADAKMGQGDEEDREKVQELERTVNKRQSVLPALESELAALNERIREAEERLARAQAGTVPTS